MNIDIFDENKIRLCRDVLKNEKIGTQYYNNILLMIFTLFGLKPVSSFGVKVKDIDKFASYINTMGLKYQKFPPNPEGYSEFVVSNSIENIDKYISIDKINNGEIERVKSFGKIFGYTDSAIFAMTNDTNGSESIKFWLEASKDKIIPEELIVDYMVFDMIPASFDDKESIKLGAKIIHLLDKIDPSISPYYIKLGQKELKKTANKNISDF